MTDAEKLAELQRRVENLLQRLENSKECELLEYDISHDGNECVLSIKTVRKILLGEWK